MELLSAVGQATKRRATLFNQAVVVAKKSKDQSTLEERMAVQAKVLVKGLRDKLMKWEEYERSVTDKTLISALASVYLGAGDSDPESKMEKAWPTVLGDMLPPLMEFLDETKGAIDGGTIMLGNQTEEFREGVGSWVGLVTRLIRYLANPSYSFFKLGEFYVKREQGYREMRRINKGDARVCPDCRLYSYVGWVPVGGLPMPGRQCRCYDRCRCGVEYR
jgi:hypothetical protein